MVSFLYDLIYLLPLTLITIIGGFSYYDYFEHNAGVFCITVMTGILCVVFCHLKSRLKYMIPGGIAVIVFAVVMFRKRDERILFILQNQWIAWAVLMALSCFWVMRLVSSYVWARRALSGFLLAGLFVIMFSGWKTEKLLVTGVFFLLLVFLAEEFQRYWKKSGYTDRKGHLVYIIPFIVAVCVTVHVIPVSDEPYDWEFAIRIWEKTTENIKLSLSFFHKNDENFANAIIGFSDDGRLMGGLQKKNKPVLHLSGKKDVGPVVYLTGMVFDEFDGKEWKDTKYPNGPATTLDALETMCAVRQYEPEFVTNYVWNVGLKIKYDSYYTRYLFMPPKAIVRGGKVGEIDVFQQGGSFVASKQQGYETEYETYFYRVNRDHETVREFLGAEHEIEENMWDETRRICGMQDEPGCDYEAYREYKAQIYEYYLPNTEVTERVREYMDELLAGTENDADKLFRIEAMLNKLNYSDTPGALPEEIQDAGDYLDYFLFTGQTGYCSYFATAFVLMARAEGIPARYVQGYYVRKDDRNEVTVTSDMAHAWPEAYIDGVGWLTFEPTPGYGCTSAWTVTKPSEESVESVGEIPEEIPIPSETDMDALVSDEQNEERKEFPMKMFMTIVIVCMVFLALFLLINLIMIKRWYTHLDIRRRMHVLYKRNLFLLNVLNYRPEQGETLEEFRTRAVSGLPEELLAFLNDYEKVLYAQGVPDEEMCMTSESANARLLERIRKTKGGWNYLYCLIRNLF